MDKSSEVFDYLCKTLGLELHKVRKISVTAAVGEPLLINVEMYASDPVMPSVIDATITIILEAKHTYG